MRGSWDWGSLPVTNTSHVRPYYLSRCHVSLLLVDAWNRLTLKEACLAKIAGSVAFLRALGACAAVPAERNSPELSIGMSDDNIFLYSAI